MLKQAYEALGGLISAIRSIREKEWQDASYDLNHVERSVGDVRRQVEREDREARNIPQPGERRLRVVPDDEQSS